MSSSFSDWSVPLSSDLALNANCLGDPRIPKPTKAEESGANHILLIDRSGSMSGVLSSLLKDLKRLVRKIPEGDSFTLGWFSGFGQFRFPIKGFRVTRNKRDEEVLDNLLDGLATTVGLTCFSEILQSSIEVIEDLKVFGHSKLNFCFFTDGYPCPETSDEIAKIGDYTKLLGEVTTSSLVIGCGPYYNKSLLAKMATNLGASLVHLGNLEDLSGTTDRFLSQRDGGGKKVDVTDETLDEDSICFSVIGDQVVLLPHEGKRLMVPEGSSYIAYYSLTKAPRPCRGASAFIGISPPQDPDLPYYAAALVLTQKARLDRALEVLSKLGDVALVEEIANAYTLDEIGALEKKLLAAVTSPSERFRKGQKPDCLPPEDAFCVLDLVKMLTADEQAVFLPCHPWFNYSRIGVASKDVHEGAKFVADPTSEARFSHLVWHSTRLNLSVRSLIKGHVSLPDMESVLGVSKYPTFKHRVYTLVKDGHLNLKALPVRLSRENFTNLLARGILGSFVDQEGEIFHHSDLLPYNEKYVYELRLDSLPVINRKISKAYESATEIGRLVLEEMELKSVVKMGKFLAGKEEAQPGVQSGVYLTAEQSAYLVRNHITSSGYSPKTEDVKPTDYYLATEFEIKVKGLSTLPSINSIAKKLASGSKLSSADKFVLRSVKSRYPESDCIAEIVGKESQGLESYWSVALGQDMVKATESKLKDCTAKLQEAKFSVILGKRWFKEFDSFEDCVLDVNGYTLTFSLRAVKVDF